MSRPLQTATLPTQETSAGAPTQPLASLSQGHRMTYAMTVNTAIIAVLAMVSMLGLLLLYLFYAPGTTPEYLIQATRMTSINLSASIVWLNLASWLSLFALWLRRYSLLAGGCLAGGIGMGELIRQVGMLMGTHAASAFAGGLVVGLLVLYVLGHIVLHRQHRWPLYFAYLVAVIGASMLTISMSLGLAIWLIWVPLVLVSTAMYLGVRRNV